MRQIIFDTETTGMNEAANNKAEGHRIIEIGCVELVDRLPTGKHFHCYFNPQREVDEGAFKVHGLSNDFLADKPLFGAKLDALEAYLDGADELIAHNIAFDRQFLDQELADAARPYKLSDKFTLVDSLRLARDKFPGARNSLDALCKRYGIDNSNRELHGALLDAELLAHVYLKLTGGQSDLLLKPPAPACEKRSAHAHLTAEVPLDWIAASVSAEELAAHREIIKSIRGK